MNCRMVLLLAALAVCGCKNSSVPGVDPFFGRTTVPPQPTGAIGRAGDPSYATCPGGPNLPPPSYGMSGSVPIAPGAGTGTVTAPGGVNPYPANTSVAPSSDGLPWTNPAVPPTSGAPVNPTWPYTSPMPSSNGMPAAGGSALPAPYGTQYPAGTTVLPGRSPALTSPNGTGAATGSPASGAGAYNRGVSTSPFSSNRTWTASSTGTSPSSGIRIIEQPSRTAAATSLAGSAASDAGSVPNVTTATPDAAATAADAAAIVAQRPRIIRNLSSNAGSDPMGKSGSTPTSGATINIADLPPADGEGTTIR